MTVLKIHLVVMGIRGKTMVRAANTDVHLKYSEELGICHYSNQELCSFFHDYFRRLLWKIAKIHVEEGVAKILILI